MRGQRRPGPQPQLPQPMADREGKARIAQVMEQLAAHLGHHVARRSMAAAGLKTQGRLAQPLIGRSEQVVVVEAVADGKAAGLLLRQRQVADGKAALLRAEWPARRPAATGAPSRCCSPGGTGPARAAADRAAAGRWLQPGRSPPWQVRSLGIRSWRVRSWRGAAQRRRSAGARRTLHDAGLDGKGYRKRPELLGAAPPAASAARR